MFKILIIGDIPDYPLVSKAEKEIREAFSKWFDADLDIIKHTPGIDPTRPFDYSRKSWQKLIDGADLIIVCDGPINNTNIVYEIAYADSIKKSVLLWKRNEEE